MSLTKEKLEELIGTKCGKLTVVEYVGYYTKEGCSENRHWYKCLCECGNFIIVDRTHLNPNNSKATLSCGCNRNIHGYSKHKAYLSYKCMMGRVKRPDSYRHKHYILNNIQVCEEWDGHPDAFCKWADENGFKEGLTLDRIDNNGDYCPDNCRWVDRIVQANNRPSYNHNLTYNGKTQSISAWAREIGMCENTLRSRINELGMSVEDALTTPVNSKFSPKNNLDK